MSRHAHRGRLSALARAASAPDLGDGERAALIRLGAPGHDPEHVDAELARYRSLLQQYRRPEALVVLEALVEPPPITDTEEDPR